MEKMNIKKIIILYYNLCNLTLVIFEFIQIMASLDIARQLLDQVRDEFNIELINTVCMIDESNRLDKIFQEEEDIDMEIEKMILDDIQHWDNVYQELYDYAYERAYDDWCNRYDDDWL